MTLCCRQRRIRGFSANRPDPLQRHASYTDERYLFYHDWRKLALSASIAGSAGSGYQQENTAFGGIGSYSRDVTVNTIYGSTKRFRSQSERTGTNGKFFGPRCNPRPRSNFTIPYGGGTSAQNVQITYNGLPVTAFEGVTSNTSSSQNWLLVSPTTTGVMMSINGAALLQGTYNASCHCCYPRPGH